MQQFNTPSRPEDEIDLTQLFNVLYKKKWIILATFIISTIIGAIYAFTKPNIYSTDALLQIEEKSSFSDSLLSGSNLLSGLSSKGNNQESVIKSRLILGKTVDHLNLQHSFLPSSSGLLNFKPLQHLDFIDLSVPNDFYYQDDNELSLSFTGDNQYTLLLNDSRLIQGKIGELFEKRGFSISVKETNHVIAKNYKIYVRPKLSAIESLQKDISIQKIKSSGGLYRLRLDSYQPHYAERILNDVMLNYIAYAQNKERVNLTKSVHFIEQQIPEFEKEISQSEKLLNEYMLTNQFVDLGSESKAKLEALARIDTQLAQTAIQEQIIAQTYTTNHPKYRTVLGSKAALERQKKVLLAKLRQLPEKQQALIKLKRDVEVNQNIYLQLKSKLQEAKLLTASRTANANIIDTAITQIKPVKPKKKLIILAAGFMGIMLACLYVLLNFMVRKRIYNIEDVTNHTGTPVLATVPFSKLQSFFEKRVKKSPTTVNEKSLLAITEPDDISIEALRGLCANLSFTVPSSGNKTILISGPTEDVGKSFISMSLAALLAEMGKKVLLIDTDFRKSYADKIFTQTEQKQDLYDWLLGQEDDIQKVISQTEIPNLDIVRKSQKMKSAHDYLKQDRFEKFLSLANLNFDFIIIDSAPVLPVADATILGKYAGTVLMVVKAEVSSVADLEHATHKLAIHGTNVSGIIINGIKQRSGNYAYYRYGDK